MATYTNLNDEIFAQAALQGYVNSLLPLRTFSTNFDGEAAKRGSDVLVPLIGGLTATTFSAYNVSGGSMSVITVTINKHKIVHVGQSDQTYWSSSKANLEAFGYQAGAALATHVFQDIFSLVTTGNFSLATAISLADFGLAQIRAARLQLSNAKVPLTGRSLLLDCNMFDNLLGITNFLQVNTAGTSETLRDGRVGRALGMDIYESNAIQGTASAVGLFAHPTAVAVAMRYLAPQRPDEYITAERVVDPGTGMVLGVRRLYDTSVGEEYLTLEAAYGYSIGITNGARVLKRND